MRAIGGGCAAEGHCYYSSARRLLVGIAPAAALPAPSPLDAQRAHLERVLCATTAVLFVVSLSYIGLSTLFACLRAAGRQPPRPDAAAPVETTKRALEKIPVVVVVQVRDDPDGGPSREGSVDAGEEECAVCLAAYASGEELRVLPACRHRFHRACVDRWLLTRAPTCPVCRAPVVVAATVLLPIGT